MVQTMAPMGPSREDKDAQKKNLFSKIGSKIKDKLASPGDAVI